MADYNGTVGFHDVRADNTITYISPSFAGFQLAGSAIAPGGATAIDGVESTETDSIAEAWSIAGIYKNGPFYASAAYESLGSDHFMDQRTVELGKAGCVDPTDGSPTSSCSYVNDDWTKWRVGLGILDWNGFTLTGIYEDQSDRPLGQTWSPITTIDPDGVIETVGAFPNGVRDISLWQIQAAYAFGNNTIKAMYGAGDRDDVRGVVGLGEADNPTVVNLGRRDNGDYSTWAVAFDHNFSKRTRAYALYTQVDDDVEDGVRAAGNSWSGFSLGMIHSF
jgi:predicted porin